MSMEQMQDAKISYLLPDVFKLFYTFSYFFQTSIDLTCGDKKMWYINLCNTESSSQLVDEDKYRATQPDGDESLCKMPGCGQCDGSCAT